MPSDTLTETAPDTGVTDNPFADIPKAEPTVSDNPFEAAPKARVTFSDNPFAAITPKDLPLKNDPFFRAEFGQPEPKPSLEPVKTGDVISAGPPEQPAKSPEWKPDITNFVPASLRGPDGELLPQYSIREHPVRAVVEAASTLFVPLEAVGLVATSAAQDVVAKIAGDAQYGGNLAQLFSGDQGPSPAEKFIAGAAKDAPAMATAANVGKIVSETSPMLGIGAAPGVAGRIFAGAFAAQTGTAVVEAAKELGTQLGLPPEQQDAGRIAELRATLVASGFFTVAAGYGTVRRQQAVATGPGKRGLLNEFFSSPIAQKGKAVDAAGNVLPKSGEAVEAPFFSGRVVLPSHGQAQQKELAALKELAPLTAAEVGKQTPAAPQVEKSLTPQTDAAGKEVTSPNAPKESGAAVGAKTTDTSGENPPPTPYTKESVKSAFNLTDDQAEAADAIVKSMGLDESKIQVAKGGTPAPGALEQGEQPAFYSRLTRTVEQSSQGKASGAQWKATIKGSKLGASEGEMDLVGVKDLEDGKTYTKQEVLDYLKANEIQVKDVTLGKSPNASPELTRFVQGEGDAMPRTSEQWLALSEKYMRTGQVYAQRGHGRAEQFYEMAEAANRAAEGLDPETGSTQGQTHFSTYQLPGAKEGSYREVLLTVPEPGQIDLKQDPKSGWWILRDKNGVQTSSGRTREDALSNAEQYGYGVSWRDGHSQYSDVANPIVRLRFNERVTADGKRILFLEEVQAPQKGEFEKMPALFQKNWREIAFKWALRHAAENGFDSVGWTRGEQQAERYSLEKQVDSLSWHTPYGDTNPEGNRIVVINPIGGERIKLAVGSDGVVKPMVATDSSFLGKPLADVIGKEVAERVMSHPIGDLRGEGLKIGGEGLKKLYDVDFRNVVNNLPAVKKAGQKVGTGSIDAFGLYVGGAPNGEFQVYQRDGTRLGTPYKYRSQAEDFVATRAKESIHSLDLTPAIRESVMGGQALFQKGKGAVEFAADGKAIIRGLASADVSTGVHEIAHVARRQLLDRNLKPEERAGITDKDIAHAESWAGAKEGVWDRPAEEKFARGFERYLRDGKAPTPTLANIFAKFKDWLSNIYQRLTGSGIDVKISPEMRKVFDRLVTRAKRIEEFGGKAHAGEAYQEFDRLIIEAAPELGWKGDYDALFAGKPGGGSSMAIEGAKRYSKALQSLRKVAASAIGENPGNVDSIPGRARMLDKLKTHIAEQRAKQPPQLRPGEKKTGELLQGEDQPFNLSGEKGVDAERIAAEKAQHEADLKAEEEFQMRNQLDLFAGSRGPGAGAKGEPGTYDPAVQLADALKTVKETDPLKRAQETSRIAEVWQAGKDATTRAWGRAVAAKESIKSNLLTLPEATPLNRLVAALDFQIQKSSALSRNLGKTFETSHPNRIRRNGIGIMVDAGLDVEKVRAALAELPDKTPLRIRRSFEAATDLTPKERDTAERIRTYFEQRLQDAQQAGVLKGFLEDYYTHVWKRPERMPEELRNAMSNGRVVTYFENARERTLQDFISGVKLGLEPMLDPALVLPRYNFNLDRAIASRAFIKKLTDTKEADGRPAVAPTGIGKQVSTTEFVVKNDETGRTRRVFETQAEAAPARREGESVVSRENVASLISPKAKSEATADYQPVDNPALKKWKWATNAPDGTPIIVQGDLVVHPDALQRIKNMMERERLTPGSAMRGLIRVGAEVKGAKLGVLSPFHQIHVGSHAIWHLVNPFSLPPEIDWTHPITRFAVEKGGLKLAADFHDKMAFSEGIGPGLVVQKIVPFARTYSEWLFESFIPRLKLKTFEAAYRRNLWARDNLPGKLTGLKGLTDEQIAARSGDSVNNAYGELNRLWLGKDGRDPRLQRAMQVTLLAPDFLEARGRFIAKAFSKTGFEERMALAVMASGLYVTARILNQLLDNDPHAKEPNMAFSVRYQGKNYSIRSVIGDATHLLTDWRSFISTRINPVTTRTAIEAVTKRDIRTGESKTTAQEAQDMLRQIVPSQLDSMLPGDRQWWFGLMQSLGVTARRQPTPEEIKKRKEKEAREALHPSKVEIIYKSGHQKK